MERFYCSLDLESRAIDGLFRVDTVAEQLYCSWDQLYFVYIPVEKVVQYVFYDQQMWIV